MGNYAEEHEKSVKEPYISLILFSPEVTALLTEDLNSKYLVISQNWCYTEADQYMRSTVYATDAMSI